MEAPRSVYLPLLSIAFYLKDKLTKVALSHHLRILRLGDNSNIRQLSSVHTLLSKYSHLKLETEKQFICGKPKCNAILILNEKRKPETNQPCGHRRKMRVSSGNECFVLTIPIEKQLVFFIEQHGLVTSRDFDPNYRGDVHSGSCYRTLRETGEVDDSTITLQLNTDGAECHKVYFKDKTVLIPL